MKDFGILEFDEKRSGYKFGKDQLLLLLLGIIVFALIIVLPIPGLELAGRKTLAIIILCLFCYANSGIPNLFATFLMFALPVIMGLTNYGAYMTGLGTSPLVMLTCLFIISAGITNTNLASRLAYTFLIKMGHSPRGIVTALTLSAVIVSALIANMPACLILAAIGTTVLSEMGEVPGQSRLGKAVMLGISTGTLVGGVAFISSSGSNATIISILESATNGECSISYAQWAAIGVPFAIIMTVVLIVLINAIFGISKKTVSSSLNIDSIREKKEKLGKMSKSETRYLLSLLIMMVLFLTSSYTGLNVPIVSMITLLLVTLPGWGTVNIREAIRNVPWEVVFFAAVSACITSVVTSSGLGAWIADIFLNWTVGLPVYLIMLVICLAAGVLNGVTMTNPASLLIPSLAVLAASSGHMPTLLAMPVCFMVGASFVTPILPDSQLTYPSGYWKYSDFIKFGWSFFIPWIVICSLVICIVGPMIGIM